jgi:hypothetical protein
MKEQKLTFWIIQISILTFTGYIFFFWWFINGTTLFLPVLGLAFINLLLTPLYRIIRGGKL